MSPYQHGEVFVTEDGAETDLDLGHYERFTDANTSRASNVTAGGDLQHGDPARAPRRLPRRHRPGRPAHHRRDQAAHPADRRDRATSTSSSPRSAARSATSSRCRSSRRSASSRSTSGAARLHVHPPDARAVHRPRRRAEDEADAALGQRAAPHRHPARHAALPLRGRALARHPQEDRAVRVAAGRGRRLRARRRQHLQGAARGSTSSGVDDFILEHFGIEAPAADLERVGATSSSARRRPTAAGADRARRQVRPARGRLHVGHRGAAPHRLACTAAASRSTGSTPRRSRTTRPRASASRDADGILDPRRLRRPRDRGQDPRRRASRASSEIPYLGICLGHADGGREFARHVAGMDGRQLDRVRPRDRVAGDRPAARAEGGLRPRRHDAPGRRPDQAARRHAGARDLRRGRHLRAPPPPLRGLNSACASASRPPGSSSPAPRPTSGSSRSIELPRRAPVLRRLAVPPRVQVAARAAGAAVPRLRRARRWTRAARAQARRRARGAARVRASRSSGADRRAVRPASRPSAGALNDTFAALCAIESPSGRERACADRVARGAARARPRGRRGRRGGRGRRGRAATCSRGSPGRGARRQRAAVRAPGHRRRTRRRSSRCSSTAAGRAPATRSSAPTTRPRSRCCSSSRGARRSRARRSASSCCSPSARRTRSRAPRPSTSSALQQRVRLRLRPRHADRRDRASPRRPTSASRPSSAARPRTPGSAPRTGAARSSRRRAAIAAMPLGRIDEETTVNVGAIDGGVGRHERRARALPRRRRGALARTRDASRRSSRRSSTRSTTRPTTRLRVRRRRRRSSGCSTGYRHATATPARCWPPRRRCARAATSRGASSPAAARTPTRSRPAGFTCVNLANGTERNHEPDERVSRRRARGHARRRRYALLDELGGG